MMLIKQSEATAARRTIYFTAVNTADDSAYTSTLSGADIRISKAGGAEANSAGTATHIATGLFKYVFDAGEVDTLGETSLRLAKTGVYNDVRVVNVVPFDPYSSTSLGLSNLDATVSSRLAGASYQDIAAMLDAADTIETGLTLRHALRLIAAATAGRSSGAGTGTEYLRAAVSNSEPRITATVDSAGNRTAITYDLSD
jgi:hypothetical protein